MSKIEWTEQTWNPVVGCTKVSQGCKHCYAETQFPRLRNRCGYGDKFTDVRFLPDRLDQPLKRKKPTLYFVNSMSDLFHEDLTDGQIAEVFAVMMRAHWHTFQVLTKRPERMEAFFKGRQAPDNVWLGVSVEDCRDGVPRIAYLQRVPAKTRFLSIEPLIGDVGQINLEGIHWVIVGGESGHKARPMNPKWAESVRNQCRSACVPMLFKQWGSWGEDGVKRPKKENGRMLDGELWDAYPHCYPKPKIELAKTGEMVGDESCYVDAARALPVGKRFVKHTQFATHADVDRAVQAGHISTRSGAAYKASITICDKMKEISVEVSLTEKLAAGTV
jgi:protein gp37